MGLDRELLRRIRGLDEFDLRRLVLFAGDVLSARVGPVLTGRPDAASSRETFRQQLVRCGKKGCRSCPHGPYWYAYRREGRRLRSRYVGKELPPAHPAS
jgi:hypothetical protein